MNPKLMLLRHLKDKTIVPGVQFSPHSNIFVIEETFNSDGQCLIEYSVNELAEFYEVLMFRNSDLIGILKHGIHHRECI